MVRRKVLRMIAHLILIHMKYQVRKYPPQRLGRPPDPPGGGIGDVEFGEDDEREIEVEGEGAPARKAKIGTLKAEANTLAHLCTHRYRNPYCESCIRAKMQHFRTKRGAFQRELKSWGDWITFDFVDMRRAADAGLGIDDGAREVLVVSREGHCDADDRCRPNRVKTY